MASTATKYNPNNFEGRRETAIALAIDYGPAASRRDVRRA
jgi:hypothetical protein